MSSVSDCDFNPKLLHNVQLLRSPIAAITCSVRNNHQQVRFHALLRKPGRSKVQLHDATPILRFPNTPRSLRPVDLCGRSRLLIAEPAPAAVSAFNSYISAVESRLAQQHRSRNAFLAPVASAPQSETRLRQGELIVEQLTPSTGADLPGALLHHWRGTAFAPEPRPRILSG